MKTIESGLKCMKINENGWKQSICMDLHLYRCEVPPFNLSMKTVRGRCQHQSFAHQFLMDGFAANTSDYLKVLYKVTEIFHKFVRKVHIVSIKMRIPK